MTNQTSTLRIPRFGKTAVSALAVALGAALLSAAPAQARDEFENGFEDQIGRLLAVEAFHFGHVVLGGGYAYPVYYGGWGRPHYEEHHHYYAPQPRYYRPQHIHHHHHGRNRDRDCDDDDRHDDRGYSRDRHHGWRY